MLERPEIREPYHPVVQLRFGKENFIVTIPPNHLVEFTAIERRGGRDQATLVFIDPTFTRIESMLLQLDKETAAKRKKEVAHDVLFYRWGFPGLGLETRPWKQGIMAMYTPTLTTAGMRISVELWAVGTQFALLTEPKQYRGKISSVVKQVALEMGYPESNIFVEDTDDEENETEPQQVWSMLNMSRTDFIDNDLRPSARSKENPSKPYHFRLALDGTFHFHTTGFSKVKTRKTPRVFKTLFGDPETPVVDFTPTYNSKRIGSIGQAVLATTFDPRTKQYQKRVLSRDNIGMSNENDPKNARTTGGGLVKSKDLGQQEKKVNAAVYRQSAQIALGGSCSGKTRHQYASPERAFAYLEHSFKVLHETISGASMELVGLPGLEDFSADELYCDVHVHLPPSAVEDAINTGRTDEIDQVLNQFGLEPNLGLHWSSGRYQIKVVTHSITSGYNISAELFRPTMLAGPDEARTGPPKKPQVTTVKTT